MAKIYDKSTKKQIGYMILRDVPDLTNVKSDLSGGLIGKSIIKLQKRAYDKARLLG